MAEYDTKAIRAAARQVKQVASGLSGQVSPLRQIERSVSGQLEGKTAETLLDEVQELRGDISSISKTADVVHHELIAFAERLEALDRAASIFFKKK